MKNILSGLFFFLLSALNIHAQPMEITTTLKVVPTTDFSSYYQLDTLLYQDTLHHYTTEVYFPYSATDKKFNKRMQDFILKQIEGSRPLSIIPEETTFSMWVIDFTTAGGYLSNFVFMYQSYTQGAAHYYHGFATFNYDGNRTVPFTEIIKFSLFNSREKFCRILNERNPNIKLTEKDLRHNTKYYLTNDALCLCFDDYEVSTSLIAFAINRESIKKYLSKRAQKRYQMIF